MKIKKDDEVIVLSGKYKGVRGTVLKSMPREQKVVVSGVNVVKRHQKAGAEGAAGIVDKTLPIHVSNVSYFDIKAGKASKIGYKILENGEKVRISKVSGEQLA